MSDLHGLAWHANSCFVDSLLLLLLHRPSRFVNRHLLRPCPALREVARHIHTGSAPATCAVYRATLDANNTSFERFNDGRARDISELLQHVLAHTPDVLDVRHESFVHHDEEQRWVRRALPHDTRERGVWTIPPETLARKQVLTVAALLHLEEHARFDAPHVFDAEDRDELAAANDAGSIPAQYTKRKAHRILRGVGSDLLLFDVRRTMMDERGHVIRVTTALLPDRMLLIQNQAFHLTGIVIHICHHYVTAIYRAAKWWLFDDKADEPREIGGYQQLLQNMAIVQNSVLYCYHRQTA